MKYQYHCYNYNKMSLFSSFLEDCVPASKLKRCGIQAFIYVQLAIEGTWDSMASHKAIFKRLPWLTPLIITRKILLGHVVDDTEIRNKQPV